MQLTFFSLYLHEMFIVPSCLITEPPYAERTASFFSSTSGLRFPSSSNFSGAIMRSSLIGKTLFCAPVSTLQWRLIFRFFSDWVISSVAKTSSRVSCRRMLHIFYGVNLDSTDCENFIIVFIAPVFNRVNRFFESRLSSLDKLVPFTGSADRLQ